MSKRKKNEKLIAPVEKSLLTIGSAGIVTSYGAFKLLAVPEPTWQTLVLIGIVGAITVEGIRQLIKKYLSEPISLNIRWHEDRYPILYLDNLDKRATVLYIAAVDT